MDLCGPLAATLSPNEAERKQAEAVLKEMEGSPGYLVQLFGLVVSHEAPIHIRQAGTILLKNVIAREWEEEAEDGKAAKLSEPDKQAVRENIVEALIYAHPLVRVQVAVALRTIANADFPDRWSSLVPNILQNIHSNDSQRCYGALLALRVLAKKYEYKPTEQRAPAEELVNVTFPVLLQLFQYLRTLHTVEAAELQKLICKIYWSCTQLVVPLYMLESAHVDAWMTCLLSLFEQPVPVVGAQREASEIAGSPWWKCKKWIGHIFDRVFTRFGNPKLISPKSDRSHALKNFSNYFTGHWAGRILQACLQMVSWPSNSGMYVPPRVMNLALSYLETAVGSSSMYKLLKPHLEGLLFQVVFPLLCYDDADEALWREDPTEYVRKQYDVLEDFYSPRTAAVNLLLKLAKSRAKECLEPLCTFLASTLSRYNATSHEHRNCREKYGVLSCFGALYDKLKSKKEYRGWLEPMLVMHVMPEFENRNGLLRAKACWVVGQYADLEFSTQSNFAHIIDCVLSRLEDPELPVRVEAAVALKALLENERTIEHLKPSLPRVLDLLFKLMDDIDNEDLVSTLEVFIEQYGDAMAPYAVQLVSKLADAFLRMASADEEDEESGLAAMGCMRAINLTLQSVHARPDLYPAMEEAMLPVIAAMLKPAGIEYFEEVLESIAYLTYFSPKISSRLWQVFAMLCSAFLDWGWDYLSNLVPPIDNFISRDPDTFVSSTNPSYLAMIFELCKKVMERDDGGETECREACKLIESVLHNCRGKIDAWVPQFVHISVNRLRIARSVALKVLLLEQISNALYYNPLVCLTTLESLSCTSEIFYAWFQLLDKFVRVHDKKIAILGLVALLKVPLQQLPPTVQSGHKHIFDAIIKLSEAIIKQREEHQRAAEEQGDEEQVASDGGDDWNSDKELEDDEDEVDEKDEAYLRMLEERAKEFAEAGDDGDELDEEDDIDYSTPVDDVDELIYFADTVQELQAVGALAVATFSVEDQGRIQNLMTIAQKRREDRTKADLDTKADSPQFS